MHRASALFGALLVAAGGAMTVAGPTVAGAAACEGEPVLLVHDLAGTADDWVLLAADLRAAGWCPDAVTWGAPRPGDVPLPVAGLTGVEAAALGLSRELGWTGPPADRPAPTAVVAKGVGALVVQRALQLAGRSTSSSSPPVSRLVTLGPVWHGTNLLGIADVEGLSRALGTFDAILAWEKTWMDRICEGCREAVRGSDVLLGLGAAGFRTPGVDYTDIVSVTDLLVHPPERQSPAGTDVRVVQDRAPGAFVWHGDLGREPVSRALVVEALATSG